MILFIDALNFLILDFNYFLVVYKNLYSLYLNFLILIMNVKEDSFKHHNNNLKLVINLFSFHFSLH